LEGNDKPAARTYVRYLSCRCRPSRVFLLGGELPRRIGRDAVEFTVDDTAVTATSLAALEVTIEELSANIDQVADAVIVLTDRLERLEPRR